jgi:hypothetical protein
VFTGAVAINGNLTVNGTQTTVNSQTVTIDDPVFTLGGDTDHTSDDNKDRGIEFRYYSGSAKLGFFGWDDSASAFTFIADASLDSSEVFSGSAGDAIFGNLNLGGTLTLPSQTANRFFVAPNGSNGVPTFRVIAAADIPNDTIDSQHYVAGSIDNEHLAANSVNSDNYVDLSIDTDHIGNDQVTYAKIQNVSATNIILGRDSAGAGIIEEISPASLRTMINVADGATNVTNTNQLTNGAGYITSYTETDTLASVTGRGSATTTSISIGSSPPALGKLNIHTGSGEATNYRDIDIKGSWAGGEAHSISGVYGTTETDLVGQITFTHTGPGSKISFGKLYHSGNQTTYPMELISNGSLGDLVISGNVSLGSTLSVQAYSSLATLELIGRTGAGFGGGLLAKSSIYSETSGSQYAANLVFKTNNSSNSLTERLRLNYNGDAIFSGEIEAPTASFTRLDINSTSVKLKGDLLGNADAAYDIGASGANRPRNLYLSNSIQAADITTTGVGVFGGNVGIGTSTFESSWTGYTVLKIGADNSIYGNTATNAGSAFFISQNLYQDASNHKYVGAGSNEGGVIDLRNGTFTYSTAPAGTAGNNATITPRLSISNTGLTTITGELTLTGSATHMNIVSDSLYAYTRYQGGSNDLYLIQNLPTLTDNGVSAGAAYFYMGQTQNFEFNWAGTSKIQFTSGGAATFSGSVTASGGASGVGFIMTNTTNSRQVTIGYTSGAAYNYIQAYDGTNFQPLVLNNALTLASTGAATFNSSVSASNYVAGTQGLNVSGYGLLSQTLSGQMTILGHNLRASNSVNNQVNVVNSGWISSMIKMYYDQGITFHTSSTVYTAGDVYPMSTTERVRITNGGNVGIGITSPTSTLHVVGTVNVTSTKNFYIDHPLESKKDTHSLIHASVESPEVNNLYRGKVDLVNGNATVNLDTVSNMTEGTFVALNNNAQCFTTNESDWDAVKGSVDGNELTISCQNSSSTANVSWMVISNRKDIAIMESSGTDSNGNLIVEEVKVQDP